MSEAAETPPPPLESREGGKRSSVSPQNLIRKKSRTVTSLRPTIFLDNWKVFTVFARSAAFLVHM